MTTPTHPSCTGPCHQGRKPCPCPESCRLKADHTHPPFMPLQYAVGVALVVWAVAVIVVPLFGGFLYETLS